MFRLVDPLIKNIRSQSVPQNLDTVKRKREKPAVEVSSLSSFKPSVSENDESFLWGSRRPSQSLAHEDPIMLVSYPFKVHLNSNVQERKDIIQESGLSLSSSSSENESEKQKVEEYIEPVSFRGNCVDRDSCQVLQMGSGRRNAVALLIPISVRHDKPKQNSGDSFLPSEQECEKPSSLPIKMLFRNELSSLLEIDREMSRNKGSISTNIQFFADLKKLKFGS